MFWYTDTDYLYGKMLDALEEGEMPLMVVVSPSRIAWYTYEVTPEAHTEGVDMEELLECMTSSRAHAVSLSDD